MIVGNMVQKPSDKFSWATFRWASVERNEVNELQSVLTLLNSSLSNDDEHSFPCNLI